MKLAIAFLLTVVTAKVIVQRDVDFDEDTFLMTEDAIYEDNPDADIFTTVSLSFFIKRSKMFIAKNLYFF